MRASIRGLTAVLAASAAIFTTQFAGSCNGPAPTMMCIPAGAPVMHTANITASETWASGVHVVPATIHVQSGAVLTIAPCTEIQLGPDASIIVDATASGIDSDGTMASPVTFHRMTAATAWGALQVTTPATAKLSFTTLDGGGGTHPHGMGADFEGATLVAQGDTAATTVPVVLTVDHASVTGSTGLGVFVRSARFDATSTQLTVTGAGWYPVYGGLASAASLPDGDYTGNAVDQILLQTVSAAVYDDTAPLSMDATLSDRGVPYRVGTTPSSLIVGSGRIADPPAVLTVDPNVTVLFTPQGTGGLSQLRINGLDGGGAGAAQGALVVLGTVATPVTFGSAADSPSPGDWQGLYFSNLVDPRTVVSGARILDAGGVSGTVGVCESAPGSGHGDASCAVVINVYVAPTPFLQMSSIVDSANCGVYREWHADQVEFAAGNEFSGVPGCVESNIPDIHNECPMTPCATAP